MTRSKKKQYAFNAASGFLEQATRMGSGFVLLPYLLWRLGPEVYGISLLAQSALVFFGFLQLGMGPTLIRFCSQAIARNDHEEIRKVSSTAQVILGSLGTIGMLAIIGFIPFFLDFYEIPEDLTLDVSVLLLCMAVSFLLNFMLIVPQGLVLGSNRYDWANGISSTGNVLRLVLIVATFELLGPSILLLGVCILCNQIFRFTSIVIVALLKVGRATIPSFKSVNRGTLKDLFGFSVLNLINSMAYSLVIQGPVLVIGKTLGKDVVAMFSPAILVASSMQGVLTQLTTPLVPLASQAQAENNLRKLGQWSGMIACSIAVIGLAIAIPLCVFGGEIVRLWLGATVVNYWLVIAIMAIGGVVTQTAGVNFTLALGGGCIRPNVYSQVVLGLFVVSGVAIGTYYLHWHLLGVALFIIFGQWTRNVFYLTYAYSKQFYYSVLEYLRDVYAKPLIIFAATVGAAYHIRNWVPPSSLVLLVVEIMVALLLYGILAWLLVLPVAIKENLRRTLLRSRFS